MDDPTQLLPAEESPLALLILFASALVEYVFPPFPGDTVTLFGAFLVSARDWSAIWVLAAVTAGSGVGASIDLWLGMLAQRKGRALARRGPRAARVQAHIEWLVERFQRYGPWFILLNRFLPGVRAFFFVAAGMAGMRPAPVLALALVSALLWNLLILAAGMGLGASWPALLELFRTYTRVVWIGIGLLAVAGLAAWWWRRRRAQGGGE